MEEKKPARRRTGAPAPGAGKAPPAKKRADRPPGARRVSEVDRQALVAKAAYFRAEGRGFAAGHELEDWLAAEAEVGATAGAAPARKSRARGRKADG